MTTEESQSNQRAGAPFLIYDGDCGFCWATVRTLRRYWPQAPLHYVTCQEATRTQLVPGLEEARCLQAALLVDRDGTVYAGADLLPRFWQLRRGDQRPLARFWHLPGLMPLLRMGYRWVARNRIGISRLLGTVDTPRRL